MELHDKQPREQNGRDSFYRYRIQTRAAAIAALAILEGKDVDRIYCDLHEDYVVRKNIASQKTYVFTQVKTRAKANQNWTVPELFGLQVGKGRPKKIPEVKAELVRDSFVGKLLLHAIAFDRACDSLVFQTNINLDDEVVEIIDDIAERKFSNKYAAALLRIFNECYQQELGATVLSGEQIKDCLAKLCFDTDVQHLKLKNHGFEMVMRDKIHHYSEVDLEHSQVDQILLKLLALVDKKSSGKIEKIDEESLEEFAGISIDDLLEILSISKDAYRELISAGDPSAIRAASIIQRVLSGAGADDEQVEFCSRCKTRWDDWFRKNRHILQELDLQAISSHIRQLFSENIGINGLVVMKSLRLEINKLIKTLEQEDLLYDLDSSLILGGFFSELVRQR